MLLQFQYIFNKEKLKPDFVMHILENFKTKNYNLDNVSVTTVTMGPVLCTV